MNERHLKGYKYFCVTIFCLILLGAFVRSMNAGLSCPDWPLCLGRIIPHYQPRVYFEFLHRVLAGLISLAAVYFNFKIILNKSMPKSLKWIVSAALVLLVGQIILGGLTVLLRLNYGIVTSHLAMGTAFFELSFWAYLSLRDILRDSNKSTPTTTKSDPRVFTIVLVAAVYGQILLGGLVASNYAGLVCPYFPLCEGSLIPTLHGLIGLQVIHRFGAYTLATIIVIYTIYVFKRVDDLVMRRLVKWLLGLIILQIGVGIANIELQIPPLVQVIHLGVAVLILTVAVRLLYASLRIRLS